MLAVRRVRGHQFECAPRSRARECLSIRECLRACERVSSQRGATGHYQPEIPVVTIVHIAEKGKRPRLHVISPVKNQTAFKGILEEIRGFWNATGFGPITRTVEGDLVGIVTFPGHTIDLKGNSRMKISKSILINVKEHEIFLGQIDEFAKDKDIYQKATIDLWCNNVAADIVNNFPYPEQIVAR